MNSKREEFAIRAAKNQRRLKLSLEANPEKQHSFLYADIAHAFPRLGFEMMPLEPTELDLAALRAWAAAVGWEVSLDRTSGEKRIKFTRLVGNPPQAA